MVVENPFFIILSFLTILIIIEIHAAIFWLGFRWFGRWMLRLQTPSLPYFSYFHLFATLYCWLLILGSILFGEWSGGASIISFGLLFIAPIVSANLSIKLWRNYKLSNFHRWALFLNIGYCCAMVNTGLVVRENSSGNKESRGHLTKMGNAHVRRILVESAWSYRFTNHHGRFAEKRRKGCPEEVVRVAKIAQVRLHRRFMRLVSRNKKSQVAVVAVARELAGFVWAMSRYFPKQATA